MKTSEAVSRVQFLASQLVGLQLELWLDNPAMVGNKLRYAVAAMRGTARSLEAVLDDLEPVRCEYTHGDLSKCGLRIPYREATG